MKRIFICLIIIFLPQFNNTTGAVGKIFSFYNNDLYSSLKLADTGLSRKAFDYALKGLKRLIGNNQIKNDHILSIADYSQPSFKKRFYVIDLKEKKLLYNTYVAHGRNSGEVYATTFSNQEGSLKSSLGFYITGNTLNTAHTGYSLLLKGVERGINDNALKRSIIMHGAEYVTENFIRKWGRTGRSFGCPALPPDLYKPVIETIKEGTCLFIYNPDPSYLSKSGLLN